MTARHCPEGRMPLGACLFLAVLVLALIGLGICAVIHWLGSVL